MGVATTSSRRPADLTFAKSNRLPDHRRCACNVGRCNARRQLSTRRRVAAVSIRAACERSKTERTQVNELMVTGKSVERRAPSDTSERVRLWRERTKETALARRDTSALPSTSWDRCGRNASGSNDPHETRNTTSTIRGSGPKFDYPGVIRFGGVPSR